jgi:hypothetical protein
VEKCDKEYFYFFVVYEIAGKIETEKEIGKLVAPVQVVDEVLNSWSLRNHDTMGEAEARDISWHYLLKKLDVSKEQFEAADAVDLTK